MVTSHPFTRHVYLPFLYATPLVHSQSTVASMGRKWPRRLARLNLSLLLLLVLLVLTFSCLPSTLAYNNSVTVVQAPLFQPGAPSSTFSITVNYTCNISSFVSGTVYLGYSVLDLNTTYGASYGSGGMNLTSSPSNGSTSFSVTLSSTPPDSALLGVKAYLIPYAQYAVNTSTAMTSAPTSSVQPISVLPNNTITWLSSPAVINHTINSTFQIVVQYTTNLYWTPLFFACDTVRPPNQPDSLHVYSQTAVR